jgi:hypothetical protein
MSNTPMADYESIDPEIQLWAQRHLLSLFTSWADCESRYVHVSSVAGECFQISVEPPKDGQVALHARCIEGQKNLSLLERGAFLFPNWM